MYKGNDASITGSLQYYATSPSHAPDHTYTEMYFYKLCWPTSLEKYLGVQAWM
jgi:hypothetical protein